MEFAARDSIRPPISTEEEAATRNTDCVYFLASPLTCKKGNECEYRHSEGARINPRDCWFWLNGNCLNPKCSFRHPPLDGLLATPTGTTSGPPLSSTQTAIPSQVLAAYAPSQANSNKQGIPCYFFQKGGCLKGDRCPFMHDLQSINSSSQQQPGKVDAPPIEPSTLAKNPSWSREKIMMQHKPETRADKPVEANDSVVKTITSVGGILVTSSMLSVPVADEVAHRLQPSNVRSVSNKIDVPQDYHLQPVDEHIQNGREPDDSLRESSPGFDVLVDDDPENIDYFHKDDEFGGTSEYASENPEVINDFDHHTFDQDCILIFDRQAYGRIDDHDQHGRQDWYHRVRHRSSERMVKRPSIRERKRTRRESSSDKLDASDLRHHLVKHRRLNGPRSMISSDQHFEAYQRDMQHIGEQRHRSYNRPQPDPFLKGSVSSRLQGRILLPERPPADSDDNMPSEGLIRRGRNWERASPTVQPLSSRSRHRGMLKERAHKDVTTDSSSIHRHLSRRQEVATINFAAPKSLSVLKGAKFSGKSEVSSSKIDKHIITNRRKELEASPTFEGPKSLSVILKRKREAVVVNDVVPSNDQEDSKRLTEEHEGAGMVITIVDEKSIQPEHPENVEKPTNGNTSLTNTRAAAAEEDDLIVLDSEFPHHQGFLKTEVGSPADNVEDEEVEIDQRNHETRSEDASGTVCNEECGENLPLSGQSPRKAESLKVNDAILVDDDTESPEQQCRRRDDEFEYETADDGRNYRSEHDEYVYEEDVDDEDGDDFARKLGAMLS